MRLRNTLKQYASFVLAFCLAAVPLVTIAPQAMAGTVTIEGGSPPNIEVETEDGGFSVHSADKRSGFKIKGRFHVDYTQFDQGFNTNNGKVDDSGAALTSSDFDVRRARVELKGWTGNWSFKLGYDAYDNDEQGFSGLNSDSRSGITDIYAKYRIHEWVHITFGQHKMPVSMEELTSTNDIVGLERDVLSHAFAPGRQAGISVRGAGDDINLTYHVALFREDFGRLSGNTDTGDNNNISMAMRMTGYWTPFPSNDNITIHAGGSFALRNLAQNSAENTAAMGQTPVYQIQGAAPQLFLRNPVNGADPLLLAPVAYDELQTIGLEVGYSMPRIFVKAEVMMVDYSGVQSGTGGDTSGFSTEFAWLITGETRPYDYKTGTYGRPKPIRPGVGAWELYARYDAVDLNLEPDEDVTYMAGVDYRATDYQTFTIGFNWYANHNVRLGMSMISAELEDVDRAGDPVDMENDEGEAVTFRLQYAF